jgi:hypothetical protein
MRGLINADPFALIDSLDGNEGDKEALREFLRGLLVGDERVYFARHLLALKEPRATIRDRLQARYQIGRSQAYRLIDTALQAGPTVPSNGTPGGPNSTVTNNPLGVSNA